MEARDPLRFLQLEVARLSGENRDREQELGRPRGAGIAGWVAEHRRPLVVRNVREDHRFYPKVDEAFGFHTRSLACVPLLDSQRVLGVLEAVNKNYDREFTDQDHDLLMVVAHLASIAISRAEAFTSATP